MAVVFKQSAGKMILKDLVATLVFSLGWIKSVAGAPSYSNVYVQSGPSLASLYGSAALTGAQYAPLSASPLMSNMLPPCVSPCVVPSQRIAALAPVATSSANFVSYQSPISVPVVVAQANDDAASYEYSYVVYDEDTGDQKAQKELSDNGVVRGQYSLVQPDGYVREVQYTADDLRGFNAVVKNFLPKYAITTGSQGKAIPPCPEVKNEPLKESSKGEAHDLEPEAQPGESHDLAENEGHGEPAESKNKETHEVTPKPEVHGEPAEHEKPAKAEEQVKTEGGVEYGEPKKEEEVHGEVEFHAEPVGKIDSEVPEPQGESETLEAKVEPVQVILKEHPEPDNVHGAEEGHEEKKEKAPKAEKIPEINALVSYNDVIKCIQAAIRGVAPTASPLTYIVLNKPC